MIRSTYGGGNREGDIEVIDVGSGDGGVAGLN